MQRRLRKLKTDLESIQARKTREVADRNVDHYTVGLVGYTNAGKSTLFNRLTAGGAYAHDKLFATLSTRVERWDLGGGNHVMVSDTVGFIRDLPHHLVASFRSTLEETVVADLLVIVLDVSDWSAEMQLDTVHETLDDIGAADQPRVLVLNKIDRLEDPRDVLVWLNRLLRRRCRSARSPATGSRSCEARVLDHMLGGVLEVTMVVPLSDGATVDFVEKRADVLARDLRQRARCRCGCASAAGTWTSCSRAAPARASTARICRPRGRRSGPVSKRRSLACDPAARAVLLMTSEGIRSDHDGPDRKRRRRRGAALRAMMPPEVAASLESWRDDPELGLLHAAVHAATKKQAFLDSYAEVLVARHLVERGCTLRVEVPTPSGRTCDFEVTVGEHCFYLHVKRLSTAAPVPPQAQRLVASSVPGAHRPARTSWGSTWSTA